MSGQTGKQAAAFHRALRLLRLSLVQIEDISDNEWVMDRLIGTAVTTVEIRAFLASHGMEPRSREAREFIADHGTLEDAFDALYEAAAVRGDV